ANAPESITVNATRCCHCTIWLRTTSVNIDVSPASPIELGVTFRSDANGYITGIRFYKSAANTGTHVANLWSNTGTLLATATFTEIGRAACREVKLNTAVAVTANSV